MYGLQVLEPAHTSSRVTWMVPPVALTPVMCEVESLWTAVESDRAAVVRRGQEGDGVACAGQLFEIVPDKMYEIHIRFRSAWKGIDSDNAQFNAELAIREAVLHQIPVEIGFWRTELSLSVPGIEA